MKSYIFLLVFLLAVCPVYAANIYWVDNNGAASWENAESDTELSGTSAASLSTANANVVAGDTVYMREGTYTTHIKPAVTGATNSVISYVAYNGEIPIIANVSVEFATYVHGIILHKLDWIKIDGITVRRDSGMDRIMMILEGADYNEIKDCIFDGQGVGGNLQMWDNKVTGGSGCLNNWIHGCTFKNIGRLSWNGSYVDDLGGFQVGVPSYDDHSNYNTFEDCTFYGGGHHLLETFTKYNVIRNNHFHNDGAMTNSTGHDPLYGADINGLWGNRNIQIYDGNDNDGMFNLLEGNRFGASGPPPDDDGGDGLTITAPKNLIRYNVISSSLNNGVLFKLGSGSVSYTNRFYNNTVYNSGRFENTGPLWQGAGIRFYTGYTNWGSVLKNNIIYYSAGNEIQGNYSQSLMTNNWLTSSGNPLFQNTNTSDYTSSTLPNLGLQASSGAIDNGISLALANGVGTNSTTLILDSNDALYFQDGSWGSVLANHLPDVIAVGTVGNTSAVSSINYSTDTLTLSTALTWADNDDVWLYSRNDGTVVLDGSAPDQGAHEWMGNWPEIHDPSVSGLRLEAVQ